MVVIDVLKGTGTAVSRGGNVGVQYDWRVYETEIVGWIRPFVGEATEPLTLQMQHGTGIRFCSLDKSGTVVAHECVVAVAL
jgi:hypothetical protein